MADDRTHRVEQDRTGNIVRYKGFEIDPAAEKVSDNEWRPVVSIARQGGHTRREFAGSRRLRSSYLTEDEAVAAAARNAYDIIDERVSGATVSDL